MKLMIRLDVSSDGEENQVLSSFKLAIISKHWGRCAITVVHVGCTTSEEGSSGDEA